MEEIRIRRKKLGISQFALAKLTGIGRFKISILEMGYSTPTADELKKLDRALRDAAHSHRRSV